MEKSTQPIVGTYKERDWKSTPASDAESLLKIVCLPLKYQRGIEAFRQIVIEAEDQLNSGVLQTTRELEVTLIQNARRESQSPRLFHIFRDAVTARCDEAMGQSHKAQQSDLCVPRTASRDRYYVVDLNTILRISWNLNECEGLNRSSATPWSKTSVHAVICSRTLDEIPEMKSAPVVSRINSEKSLPATPSSWTSAGLSHHRTTSSANTSPSTLSDHTVDTSISSTSPILKTPDVQVDYCPECYQEFKGAPPNRRSNLLRHLKGPRHNADAGFRCLQQDCVSTKPMRCDNLRHHLQKVHEMTTQAEVEGAIQRSKGSKRIKLAQTEWPSGINRTDSGRF